MVKRDFVSLLDVYPTLCDLGNVDKPTFLNGYSLAPLLFDSMKSLADVRPDHVIAQYHSTFSATGTFMVRRDQHKLIRFGMEQQFPPLLFNVDEDPFELQNLAWAHTEIVANLTALLDMTMDWRAADARAKSFQRSLYNEYMWDDTFKTSDGCTQAFLGAVFADFDVEDAKKIETWSGRPCRFVTAAPTDPVLQV